MWDGREVLDACAEAMHAREHALRAERAVYGLDALDETDLHAVLVAGLAAHGWGVHREWPYPGVPGSLAKRSERDRCDAVLTRAPGESPMDPVARSRELAGARGTLFEGAIAREEPLGVPVERCFWLEVKVVAQHTFVRGVPLPNAQYASQLVHAFGADLTKLGADERIVHAGVLVVLFAQDEPTAAHDAALALHRVLDKGVGVRSSESACVPILDRAGNAVAHLTLAAPKPVRE